MATSKLGDGFESAAGAVGARSLGSGVNHVVSGVGEGVGQTLSGLGSGAGKVIKGTGKGSARHSAGLVGVFCKWEKELAKVYRVMVVVSGLA